MKALVLAAVVAATAITGVAQAQTHGVPQELLKNTRRLGGDTLQVCGDVTGKTKGFDQAVARAIGDALFLKVQFHEGFGGFPTSGDGFLDELQIALTNTCDMMVGVTVQANSPFPEWAVLSRPYVSLPYLLVVKDDYKSLLDVPVQRHLGTAMSSMGERVFITWNQQRPKEQRYVRYPYADMDLMTTRVLDGSIAGMVIWGPAWAEVQKRMPEAAQLHSISMQPVPDSVTRVGILMKVNDSYLRAQIDETIDALVADGTIESLLEEFGYEGIAGDAPSNVQ